MDYDREENVNTPEYWDKCWSRAPEDGHRGSHVFARVAQILDGIGGRVVEFGFGGLHLARLVGKKRWKGYDFSKTAVEFARAEGFAAQVKRCRDSEGFRRSTLVALEVLEHLDEDEMFEFLDRSKNAPHAVFSVPMLTEDKDIGRHMRGWATPEEFKGFLERWWPHVAVEVVTKERWTRLVAHCTVTRAPALTVGTSTLKDFYGTLYTLNGFRSSWGDLVDNGTIELVLVDNRPAVENDDDQAEIDDMKKIAEDAGARYVHWNEKQGTYPGKNRLKVEASAPWVLTFDSHVFLSARTIETVFGVIEKDPLCQDFFHFPCIFKPGVAVDYRNLQYIYHGREKPCYGWTGEMNKPGDPYPIAAMITSCYLLRRDAWLSAGGYDPILGNYGGWEGPLQTKWWMMGRRVLSLRHPTPVGIPLHHWHHFNNLRRRFKSATDSVHGGESKTRNFVASSTVIGGEAFARWYLKHKAYDRKYQWQDDRAWNYPFVQQGFNAGMEHRADFVSKLADPEWEDIFKFFAWMKAENIPGHMRSW